MKRIQGKHIAAKAKQIGGKIKAQRVAESGVTTHIRGHILVSGKRVQTRRNVRQATAR